MPSTLHQSTSEWKSVSLTSIRDLGFFLFLSPCVSIWKAQQVSEQCGFTGHRVQQFPPQLLPAGGTTHHHNLQVYYKGGAGVDRRCVYIAEPRSYDRNAAWLMCVYASPDSCCCYMVVFQFRRFRKLQKQRVELGQALFLSWFLLRQRQHNLK